MLEAVDRIVGGARQPHVHLAHDPPAGELVPGQLLPGFLPDALGRLAAKQPIADAQRSAEFHVGPVIQRVAERGGDGLGPFLELLAIRGVARAITFLHAVGAHRAPLVMVAVEPGLGEVLELLIFGDLLRRQVTMVVDNRHVARVLVVQRDRSIVLQQKVLCNEDVLHDTPFHWRLKRETSSLPPCQYSSLPPGPAPGNQPGRPNTGFSRAASLTGSFRTAWSQYRRISHEPRVRL